MKIATLLNYANDPNATADQVVALEQAGLDTVWIPEAYTFDAPSLMGFIAARTTQVEIASGILPIYSRTPTLMAMTAAGIDALSGGRAILGLGASGPQVIEGFHGVAYDKPLGRTKDIIEICRKVWRRERLEHQGSAYTIPLPPEQGTGLGKALKLINHPVRDSIPIYVAALGPKSVEQTAQIANGWLPFLFWPEKAADVWGNSLRAGLAARDDSLGRLEIAAGGLAAFTDDPDKARAIRDFARPMIALYVGGMGAREKNFYNDVFAQYGLAAAAKEIQDLYLDGKKAEAAAAIPDEVLVATNLVGSRAEVKDRIAAFREAGVTMLNVTVADADQAGVISTLKEIAS